MRWFRPHRDDIDAVLGDAVGDDDLAPVAAVVHALRSAYIPETSSSRSPALRAFTDAPLDDNGDPLVTAGSNANGSALQTAGLPNRDTTGRNTKKMLSTLSAFVATAAGKAVIGATVAAASIGGLHAADVVEIPGLPEEAEEQVSAADERGDGEADLEEIEAEENEPEEIETEDAQAPELGEGSGFSVEMQAWSDCVEQASAEHDEATAEHDAEGGNPPEAFDPFEACGDHPHARDLAPGADQASDNRPDDVPAGPEDTPAAERPEPEASEAEGGEAPADAGPPSDVPPAAAGDDAEDAGPPADAGSQGEDRP